MRLGITNLMSTSPPKADISERLTLGVLSLLANVCFASRSGR